jgi:hypothetical protein
MFPQYSPLKVNLNYFLIIGINTSKEYKANANYTLTQLSPQANKKHARCIYTASSFLLEVKIF